MANKGYNSTKITVSLTKPEREALRREAERRGVPLGTLCAMLLRERIRVSYAITDEPTEGENK